MLLAALISDYVGGAFTSITFFAFIALLGFFHMYVVARLLYIRSTTKISDCLAKGVEPSPQMIEKLTD